MAVSVRVYGLEQKPVCMYDEIALAHTKLGYPVEVRITAGNQSFIMHLSLADAMELQQAIADVRRGRL